MESTCKTNFISPPPQIHFCEVAATNINLTLSLTLKIANAVTESFAFYFFFPYSNILHHRCHDYPSLISKTIVLNV